ncbi:GPI-anchored CFEM domain protein [Teratosphaeria destructans]|uniref:GPI-anchored CFEM domain protein n=1 Tax=Teratosphaeria destructans TaxID=418781 RepID=A0A9W7SP19_9PEZI|nr:GPI-anchored CFEM domain protein [Teratosphaeria destructans]
MRTFTLGLVAALASVVCGADVPGLPACAASCVTNFGSCNQLDVKCICSSKTLIADLACCVSKVCDAAAQASTITFANALCQGQGVNDLPQTATCASTAASATAPASTPSSAANSTSNDTSAATPSSAAMVMSSAAASGTATSKPTTTATTTAASSTATAGAMATASIEWLGAAGLGVILAALVAAM